MCGYVGFTNHLDNAPDVLEDMMNQIVHRGPDSEGRYLDDEIALGFRRLSIIDLQQGDQPIFNEDGSKVLLFNGEIYNYQPLREALMEKGHTFASRSDSEVLIHGYEEYGVSLLNKLRGMFSFVIWDKNTHELFGARDFFGIKPLYYAQAEDGTLLFGSEIKAFLPHPAFRKELNLQALENYLSFQYSPGSDTFFKNVYKLLPAHYFLYKDGAFTVTRYWEPQFVADESKTCAEWVDEIANVFADSVEAHKISDVEVGSFLSSGVDSSYVAASANVDKTFTVGFDSDGVRYNEISYAKELSDYIKVKNTSKVITPEEYWDSLSKIQYHMDEPLADPAAVALYFVCNLASKELKVVLSGEGADEIFGGYNVYKEPIEFTAYNKIPMPIRRLIGKVAGLFPAHRGLNFLVRRGQTLEERFIGNAYMFTERERHKLLRQETGAPSPAALCKPYYERVANQDAVTKMQYLDLHMWMAGDILLKADKMSMANSLELRVPFLDKEVMEVARKIPTAYRVNEKNTKYAMRQAALRKIPQKSADKKKLGFPVPIRVWLKEDKYYQLVKDAFLSEVSKTYFNTDCLIRLLDDHKKGKRDNSRKIWTVFMFLKWYDEFFVKRP